MSALETRLDNRDIALGANRLPALAGEIQAAHSQCRGAVADAVRHAVEAGRCLNEAKQLLPHGQWEVWLRANLPEVSVRTAQRYMRASSKAGKNDTVSFSSVRELIAPEPREKPRPLWLKIPQAKLAEWWETYPQDLNPSIRYLAADDKTNAEIAAILSVSENKVATDLGAPPVLRPTCACDAELAPAIDAAIRSVWYGSAQSGCMQAGWWAKQCQRPDLERRLKVQHDRFLSECEYAETCLYNLTRDLVSYCPAWLLGWDICREWWGLEEPPANEALFVRYFDAKKRIEDAKQALSAESPVSMGEAL